MIRRQVDQLDAPAVEEGIAFYESASGRSGMNVAKTASISWLVLAL